MPMATVHSELSASAPSPESPDRGAGQASAAALQPTWLLEPQPGAARDPAADTGPTVRIFLGTETAQWRAERVFVWSVQRYRDPARRYAIYRLKDLPGFDTSAWRTGFTNYRFAIPELCGGHGRAIYNDVDQLYLTDPALLFDLELDGHGYRAVSAEDTSVMLIDCERMLRHWNLAQARSLPKRALVRLAAEEPGCWGPLDDGWNARDGEPLQGAPRVLHFTALHTQPWRPTPEQYSYHPHPQDALWHGFEQAADEAGFELFSAGRPSPEYAAAVRAAAPAADLEAAQQWLRTRGVDQPEVLAPAAVAALHTAVPAQGAIAYSLEAVPPADLGWYLATLATRSPRALHLQLRAGGSPAGKTLREPDRWRREASRILRRYPRLAWQLEIVGHNGRRQLWRHDPVAEAPLVWVLHGQRHGDNRPLDALAARMAARHGWRVQALDLEFSPPAALPPWLLGASRLGLRRATPALAPPWPDLVLAAGRRSAPVARWIARASGARLVHLNRPWAPLRHFDLVLSPPQYLLPGRDNVCYLPLPLSPPAVADAEVMRHWQARLAQPPTALPKPWLVVLVGGASRPQVLDVASARALAGRLQAWVGRSGGSVLVTGSPRTPAEALDALGQALQQLLPGRHHLHRFGGEAPNPYAAWLALADRVLVTSDSAAMLADALGSGRPVSLHALPRRPDLRSRTVQALRRVLCRSTSQASYRGTPKQQRAGARLFDRLVEGGLLTSLRDLDALHQPLRAGGYLVELEQEAPAPPTAPDALALAETALLHLAREPRAVETP